jgi:hypothetical protein
MIEWPVKALLWAIFAMLLVGLTRQEFVHHYGRNVYEVRLELAMQLYVAGKSPKEAFAQADEFIDYLKTQER